MNPRLSGHFSVFGLVFFVFKSLLGIARQRKAGDGAFGYLASPVKGLLFSDCLPERAFRAYFSQQNSLLWP